LGINMEGEREEISSLNPARLERYCTETTRRPGCVSTGTKRRVRMAASWSREKGTAKEPTR
jgi:hypothetical protein